MESNVILGIISAIVIAVTNVVVYQLGKSKAEEKHNEEIAKNVAKANQVRNTLGNHTVLDKLRKRYSR